MLFRQRLKGYLKRLEQERLSAEVEAVKDSLERTQGYLRELNKTAAAGDEAKRQMAAELEAGAPAVGARKGVIGEVAPLGPHRSRALAIFVFCSHAFIFESLVQRPRSLASRPRAFRAVRLLASFDDGRRAGVQRTPWNRGDFEFQVTFRQAFVVRVRPVSHPERPPWLGLAAFVLSTFAGAHVSRSSEPLCPKK